MTALLLAPPPALPLSFSRTTHLSPAPFARCLRAPHPFCSSSGFTNTAAATATATLPAATSPATQPPYGSPRSPASPCPARPDPTVYQVTIATLALEYHTRMGFWPSEEFGEPEAAHVARRLQKWRFKFRKGLMSHALREATAPLTPYLTEDPGTLRSEQRVAMADARLGVGISSHLDPLWEDGWNTRVRDALAARKPRGQAAYTAAAEDHPFAAAVQGGGQPSDGETSNEGATTTPEWRLQDVKWYSRLDELVEFVGVHGYRPSTTATGAKERALARFLSRVVTASRKYLQGESLRGSPMTPARMERWEAAKARVLSVPKWVDARHRGGLGLTAAAAAEAAGGVADEDRPRAARERWHDNLEAFQQHVKEFGCLPRFSVEAERPIYSWWMRLRTALRERQQGLPMSKLVLTDAMVEDVERLDRMLTQIPSRRDLLWKERLQALITFVTANRRMPSTSSRRPDSEDVDGEGPRAEDEHSLAYWWYVQIRAARGVCSGESVAPKVTMNLFRLRRLVDAVGELAACVARADAEALEEAATQASDALAAKTRRAESIKDFPALLNSRL